MSSDMIASLVRRIDGKLMMRHVAEFARWTKHAGTPEELKSLEYVRAEMERYGFACELILHDAYISLPGKAKVVFEGKDCRCITHSFSRSSPAAGLKGRVVAVGAGTPAHFAKVDARGAIVLVDGIANPAVTLRASRAGAIGQLHVSPHEHLHEMCISPVWGSPTHEQVDNLPKTVVVTIPLETGDAVKAALARTHDLDVTLHAAVDTGWRKTPILACELSGPSREADDPFVLFSGHHDTWYYGVMDNGGANATMLEVSRLAALERKSWQRGLRVIYWSGHSQGRYSSSSWYADTHWEELEARAVAHVNVDSTGGKGNTIVADTTSCAELASLARAAIAEQGKQTFSGRRMSRAGDQAFWGIGVPAIFGNMSEQPAGGATNASAAVFGGGNRLGHGTGWWWHTPDDLADKMDEGILVRDTAIYMHVVWRLLSDAVLPLDYAEHAAYVSKTVDGIAAVAGSHFDLAVIKRRAEALAATAARLNGAARTATSPKAIARINAALMAISRSLVPVDYSTGDRFGQDPALAQEAYPSLQAAREFATLDASGDRAKFLTVGMMRARNRVAHALRKAEREAVRCLDDLKTISG